MDVDTVCTGCMEGCGTALLACGVEMGNGCVIRRSGIIPTRSTLDGSGSGSNGNDVTIGRGECWWISMGWTGETAVAAARRACSSAKNKCS